MDIRNTQKKEKDEEPIVIYRCKRDIGKLERGDECKMKGEFPTYVHMVDRYKNFRDAQLSPGLLNRYFEIIPE
jgi:hypothetical protein